MIKTALISFLTNSINTRSLSSYLKKNGHEVTCFFCVSDFNRKNLNALMQMISDGDFGLVGVSLVTDDYKSAVLLTREIKQKLEVPVIWGGAHVNIRPEECLQHADMICLGEGEDALLDLVRNIGEQASLKNTTIKNIWFKTESGIVRNDLRSLEENLDKYPFPDFDLASQYVMYDDGFEKLSEKHFGSEYSIMTSRGCPYSCDYCYNSYRKSQYRGLGTYLRRRSVEHVIAELSHAKQLFRNLKKINFWDDSFVARSIDEFQQFKEMYTKQINLPFFALIEPMVFQYDKIKLLKECGLSGLQVGVQSGSERVNREIYGRKISNEKIIEVAQLINSLGINVVYDLIFNNPYETKADIMETICLLQKFPRPFLLQGYNLIFYPGTAMTEKALHDRIISDNKDADKFSTIQSTINSPIARRGRGEVSSRFYTINYDSREKEYLNSVLTLLAYRFVPNIIVRYFYSIETPLRRQLLKLFLSLYTTASVIKNEVIRR